MQILILASILSAATAFSGLNRPTAIRFTTPKLQMAWGAKESNEHFLIAPSILSADFARLGDEVNNVLAAGADVVHFDVMGQLKIFSSIFSYCSLLNHR